MHRISIITRRVVILNEAEQAKTCYKSRTLKYTVHPNSVVRAPHPHCQDDLKGIQGMLTGPTI